MRIVWAKSRPTVAALLLSVVVAGGCGSRNDHLSARRAASLPAAESTAAPGLAPAADLAGQGSAGATASAASPAGQPVSSNAAPQPSTAPGASVSPGAATPASRAAAGSNPSGSKGPSGTKAAAGAPGPTTKDGVSGGSAAKGGATPAPGPAPAAGGTKAEIRLGSFGAESGIFGRIFAPIVQGAKAWVADVNSRGGLNGHSVAITFGDDGADPNRAQSLVRQMVEQQKVQAFYAPHAATTLGAVLPYLEQVQVPVIGGCPCQDDPQDESPISFPLGSAKAGMEWQHIVGLVELSDAKKVAVFACRESPSCARIGKRIQPTLKTLGREVVYFSEISLAQPDFTAEIIAARNAGAEALVAIVDNATIIRLARTAHRQQWRPLISTQMSAYQQDFLKSGGEEVEGLVMGSVTVPWSTSPKLADFRDAMQRYVPGGSIGNFASHEWVVGKMLETVARSFPANPTAKDFIEGLYSLRGDTFGGLVPPISYARNQGHGGTHQCSIPVKIDKGQFVPLGDEAWKCPPGYKPVGQ